MTEQDPNADAAPDGGATEKNISTENQPKGAARNPSDTLNREGERVDPGQRQWNGDSDRKPA